VTGDHDRLVPPATASALADAIPAAQLRVVPGAGHPLLVFEPDEVARAIAEVGDAR
jgi:pimeloyl-[acyl-carrier protein] methyl ester esterase